MTVVAQEFTQTFFNLPEEEQEEIFKLIASQRKNYVRKRLNPAFEKLSLIGCIESENGDLSVNYKDHLWGSDKPNKPLKLGLFKGKIKMSDDFNEPLPDSFWLEGKP